MSTAIEIDARLAVLPCSPATLDDLSSGAGAPPLPPCGVLAPATRVRFTEAQQDHYASRNIDATHTYTVTWCGWDDASETMRLRLMEMPGFTFKRSMFVEVA